MPKPAKHTGLVGGRKEPTILLDEISGHLKYFNSWYGDAISISLLLKLQEGKKEIVLVFVWPCTKTAKIC